ncbi:hypothetical protein BDA96_09G256200 [Sorghum bicolor]|uniref:Uncharacterized protein n=1 Tax=Sorghum bicolor TaxID=4558 RepID=A0A921QBS0_SORBI|nr:hypothetical protein BDA96_09G256200 [Sorghum bicolor]
MRRDVHGRVTSWVDFGREMYMPTEISAGLS